MYVHLNATITVPPYKRLTAFHCIACIFQPLEVWHYFSTMYTATEMQWKQPTNSKITILAAEKCSLVSIKQTYYFLLNFAPLPNAKLENICWQTSLGCWWPSCSTFLKKTFYVHNFFSLTFANWHTAEFTKITFKPGWTNIDKMHLKFCQ
jgi:hypothetical protein